MATFKAVILATQQRVDGSYNLKIRVIHNRQTKYIKTPYYVDAKEVMKKKVGGKVTLKIKNQSLLDLMDDTIIGYKKKLLTLGNSFENWDVDRLVTYLTTSRDNFSLDFIDFCKKFVESMKREGRVGTAKTYELSINALVRFIGRDKLDISEINYTFLKAFENHLRCEPVYKNTFKGVIKTKKLKNGRALYNYLFHIKAMHERAKDEYNDEECGIINIPYSPFKKYKIPAPQPTEHRVLSVGQIQKIIDLPYKGRGSGREIIYNMAKDVFLLSFALMGINTADIYEASALEGNILSYNRRKTRTRRKDSAQMKVRIEPKIMGLFERCTGKELVFRFGEKYSTPINFNRAVNAGLKQLGKDIGVSNLTFYHARHSMASICANKLGIDIARVDEMLNHSDPKLSLARVYIAKDYEPIWDANKKLIDLFDWSFYDKGE